MQPHFRQQVALVVDGPDGCASSIALALGEAGARIALAGAPGNDIEATAAGLRERGVDVLVVAGDLSDRAGARQAAEAVVAHYGGVHILASAAAYRSDAPLAETPKDEWDRAYAVNVGVVVNLLQEFLPILLRQQAGGHIVARIPLSGLVGGGTDAVRAVHAGAVAAIMESLFGELRGQSIGASLLITSDAPVEAGGVAAPGIGARVARGIAEGEVFIFADPVPPDTIRRHFSTIFDALPPPSGGAVEGPGGNSEEMFPTYAAVLRAKGMMADA